MAVDRGLSGWALPLALSLAAAGCATASPTAPSFSATSRPAPTCSAVPGVALTPTSTLSHGRDGTWVVVDRGRMTEAVQVSPPDATLHRSAQALCADRPVRVVRRTTSLVEGASWRATGTARSLSLRPGWAARAWPASTDAIVTELRERYPEIALPGMVDQLRCHVVWVPDKPRWHLEPDRPHVGYPATVAARCSPGHLRDIDGL